MTAGDDPASEGHDTASGSSPKTAGFGEANSGERTASREVVPQLVPTRGSASMRITGSGIITVTGFPSDWDADRQAAIKLLEELPRLIRDAERGRRLLASFSELVRGDSIPGLGHNHNLELSKLADDGADTIADAEVAGDALLAQLRSETNSYPSIRLAGRVLRRTLAWVKEIVEKLLKDRASQAVGVLVTDTWVNHSEQELAYISPLQKHLTDLVASIGHLLTMMGMPF